jgi:predicted lipoprotein with Yx(FWY)xxD motif
MFKPTRGRVRTRPLATMRRLPTAVVAVALGALVLAGCGGSSSSGSSGGSTVSSSTATVTSKNVPGYGTVLSTSSGKTLYVLSTDPKGGSKCAATCVSKWKPLTPQGKPTAGPGVSSSLLSTFKRSDGTTQVLYNGHALYTYTVPGATAGAGVTADGGTWYLVSPSGQAIKPTGSGYY